MKKKISEKLISKWSVKAPLYIDKKDKRYKKYVKQLKRDGFSNTETWGLYSVIAEFVLPRLKRFKEITICYPMDLTMDKWRAILDKMIFSFDWILTNDELKLNQNQLNIGYKKCDEGIELFSKYFRDLWW
jgi:hypothetical protein